MGTVDITGLGDIVELPHVWMWSYLGALQVVVFFFIRKHVEGLMSHFSPAICIWKKEWTCRMRPVSLDRRTSWKGLGWEEGRGRESQSESNHSGNGSRLQQRRPPIRARLSHRNDRWGGRSYWESPTMTVTMLIGVTASTACSRS